MYKNEKIFYPIEFYYSIDFNFIKEKLKNHNEKYIDYGSIFVVEKKDYMLTVNEVGKIDIFYDDLDEKTILDTAKNVESLIKSQVKTFSLQI